MAEGLERVDIIRSRRRSSVKADELPPVLDAVGLPEDARSATRKSSLVPLPSSIPSSTTAAGGAGTVPPSIFSEKLMRGDTHSRLAPQPSAVRDLPPLTTASGGGGEKEDAYDRRRGGSVSSTHSSSGGHRQSEHRHKKVPDEESNDVKTPPRSDTAFPPGGSTSTKVNASPEKNRTNTKNNTHDDDDDDDDRPAVVTIVSAKLTVDMEDNADNSSSLLPIGPGTKKPRKPKRVS